MACMHRRRLSRRLRRLWPAYHALRRALLAATAENEPNTMTVSISVGTLQESSVMASSVSAGALQKGSTDLISSLAGVAAETETPTVTLVDCGVEDSMTPLWEMERASMLRRAEFFQSEGARLASECASLSRMVSVQREDLLQLETERAKNAKHMVEIDRLQCALSTARERLVVMEETLRRSEMLVAGANAACLQATQAAASERQTSITALVIREQELTDTQKSLKSLHLVHEADTARIQELTGELRSTKSANNAQVTILTEEIQKARDALQLHEKELAALRNLSEELLVTKDRQTGLVDKLTDELQCSSEMLLAHKGKLARIHELTDELEALKTDLTTKDVELADMTGKIAAQTSELARLCAELAATRELLLQKEDELSEVCSLAGELQVAKDDQLDKINELTEELKASQELLLQWQGELVTMRNRIDELQGVSELLKQREDELSQLHGVGLELQSVKELLQQREDELTRAHSLIIDLEARRNAETDQLHQLEAKHNILRLEDDELKAERELLQLKAEELANLQGRFEASRQLLQVRENELEQLKPLATELQTCKELLLARDAELARLKSLAEELSLAKDHQLDVENQLSEELQQCKSIHSEEIVRLSQKLVVAQEKLQDRETELHTQLLESQLAKGREHQLQQELLETQQAAVHATIITAFNGCETEDTVYDLECSLQRVNRELAECQSTVSDLRAQMATDASLNDSRTAAFEGQLKTLKTQLAQMSEVASSRESALVEERDAFGSTVAELSERVSHLTAELEELQRHTRIDIATTPEWSPEPDRLSTWQRKQDEKLQKFILASSRKLGQINTGVEAENGSLPTCPIAPSAVSPLLPYSPPQCHNHKTTDDALESMKKEHENILHVWHNLGSRIYRDAMWPATHNLPDSEFSAESLV